MDFHPWPKMTRLDRVQMTITEKIDGTNAQIAWHPTEEGGLPELRAGSRTRWLTPQSDNFGFASMVEQSKDELMRLLPLGTHYGEWAGPGIQKNPLKLPGRRFFAFNVDLWQSAPELLAELQAAVPWFDVVPIWYRGPVTDVNHWQAGRPPLPPVRQFDGVPEGFVVEIGGCRWKWTEKGAKYKEMKRVQSLS